MVLAAGTTWRINLSAIAQSDVSVIQRDRRLCLHQCTSEVPCPWRCPMTYQCHRATTWLDLVRCGLRLPCSLPCDDEARRARRRSGRAPSRAPAASSRRLDPAKPAASLSRVEPSARRAPGGAVADGSAPILRASSWLRYPSLFLRHRVTRRPYYLLDLSHLLICCPRYIH